MGLTEQYWVLADETPTRTLWALGDNQGTIRDLIDNGGSLVEHLTYDSFGKIVSTPITDFRYGYTGREQDSETGLDYYRARYYDAANGRFISEDPIGFDAGDGNLTRYVGNSPTNFVDPSGYYPVDPKYLPKVLPPTRTFPQITPLTRPTSPGGLVPLVIFEIFRRTLDAGSAGNREADEAQTRRNNERFQGPLYYPQPRTQAETEYRPPNPNFCPRPERCPTKPIPTFVETRAYPEHYALVKTAIRYFGKPTVLTKADKKLAILNRRYGSAYFSDSNKVGYGSADFYGTNSALVKRPYPTRKSPGSTSYSNWDEYPYASTAEAADGSIFAAVNERQNTDAGNALGAFYRANPRLTAGCKFVVRLAP